MALRELADVRSLLFLALTLFCLLMGMAFPPTGVWAFALFAINTFLCFVVHIINHNHAHLPIFRGSASGALNVFVNVAISVCKGSTSTTIYVPHMLNHHVYEGSKEDWIRPSLAAKDRRFFAGARQIFRYIAAVIVEMSVKRRQASAPALKPQQKTLLRLEKFTLLISLHFCCVGIFWLQLSLYFCRGS